VGILFDIHHGQRPPLEPCDADRRLGIFYGTRISQCVESGDSHTSGLEPLVAMTMQMLSIISEKLVLCGLFGSTSTACTGSRACREKRRSCGWTVLAIWGGQVCTTFFWGAAL
jgi:hypothetical protein